MAYSLILLALAIGYVFVLMGRNERFSKLLHSPPFLAKHLRIAGILAAVSLIKILSLSTVQLGDLLLWSPLLYLSLTKAADAWTMRKHKRHLIKASKLNMASEETKDASFSDYAWFIIVHFVPLVLPLFVFDVIMGKTL